ncbi:hypothetical protein [Streptomyces sp. NPDC004270]
MTKPCVAILSGAGISTDSGIPSKHPEHGADKDDSMPAADTVRT